ncbi:MAG: acylneuraminate cytidylyltransferase family protein [Bacteroidales bacterium]|nr:acylneuraminate cytidylyltransferase family protein [Bacteroidales bacterium]
MRVLGIIPARCGSKRVVDKNIKALNGKPLIEYTINAAKDSNLLDRVIVSTDCETIAKVCRTIGAEVPFLRPADIANDSAADKAYLLHAIEYLEKTEGYTADAVMILRPTSPFKTANIIDEVIELLQNTNADSVRTMTKSEGVFHPYWMYKKTDGNKAIAFSEEAKDGKYYQSQLLPDVYRLNGVVDAIKVEVLKSSETLYGNDMRIVEVDEEFALDIDTELDFKIADFLMRAYLKK